jgi:N-methylhydantoinase A
VAVRAAGPPALAVGIDVGGTFTDLAAIAEDGRVRTAKVLSRPADQSVGVLDALAALGEPASSVARVVHGTTVVTNLLLERTGARVAFCGTAGHTDVLHLRRQDRASLYDLAAHHPPPLVARADCVPVAERTGPAASSSRSPTRRFARSWTRCARRGPEAVAVTLLHAYAHPGHERRLVDALARALPGVAVVASHEVHPEPREFERASTTAAEAYARPRVARYVARLAERLAEGGYPAPGVMTSGGGVRAAAEAAAAAAALALSGPAGGVVGAAAACAALGIDDALTLDVGGTSADVGLVLGGAPLVEAGGDVAGRADRAAAGARRHRVRGRRQRRVGGRRGRAARRPAERGRGAGPRGVRARRRRGDRDRRARRARPHRRAPAERRRDARRGARPRRAARARRAAGRASAQRVPGPGGRARARGGRRRGGGARAPARERRARRGPARARARRLRRRGGLHACALAERVGTTRVLVPPHAGVLSAVGLAAAPDRRDALASVLRPADGLSAADLTELVAELARRAGAGAGRQTWVRARYSGQGHEIEVPVSAGDDGAAVARRFAELHARRTGFTLERGVEVTSARHAASTPGAAPRFARAGPAGDGGAVVRDGGGVARARDAACAAGLVVQGPATIALADATVLVPAGWAARALETGGWMLEAA